MKSNFYSSLFISFYLISKLAAYIGGRFTTAQTLIFGYLIFITIGSALLMLPVSSAGGQSLPFIDALFTATSAISGTGLIVVDTGAYFSLFGQGVILVLIQIGNIGYMLFFALAVVFLGGKLSVFNRLIIKESISNASLNLILFIKKVFKYTFVIEFIAAILLTAYWWQEMPFIEAVKQGIFHSVSAFCTAGFSLFSNSLMDYRNDYFINAVIIATAYIGCIGFFVIYDLSYFFKSIVRNKRYKLSTHSKIVLTVSLSIIIISALIILVTENFFSEVHESKSVLESFFQSATASTCVGFNTVDVNEMEKGSKFILTFEMFIGASPSSTGGGIKTTVFAIMCLSLFTFIRDRKNVNVMKRSVHPTTIARAFSISLLALFWLFLVVLVLSTIEEFEFLQILFEAASALGNVGLSTGITPGLSDFGRMLLSVTMLVGRVGPLIVGYTLLGKRKDVSYSYPEGSVLIV